MIRIVEPAFGGNAIFGAHNILFSTMIPHLWATFSTKKAFFNQFNWSKLFHITFARAVYFLKVQWEMCAPLECIQLYAHQVESVVHSRVPLKTELLTMNIEWYYMLWNLCVKTYGIVRSWEFIIAYLGIEWMCFRSSTRKHMWTDTLNFMILLLYLHVQCFTCISFDAIFISRRVKNEIILVMAFCLHLPDRPPALFFFSLQWICAVLSLRP